MPPKTSEPPRRLTKKEREALEKEQAMKQAADDAQRLFKFHEKERRSAETVEKFTRDSELFDKAREKQRIDQEREQFKAVASEVEQLSTLALSEAKKHHSWNTVMEVSWLPDVDRQNDINSFLTTWQEEQLGEFDAASKEQNALVKFNVVQRQAVGGAMPDIENLQMHLVRTDTGPSQWQRNKKVDTDLSMCVSAVQLADRLWCALDLAMVVNDKVKVEHYRENLCQVYRQIINSIDTATCSILQYLDVFIQRDEEYLLKAVPRDNPIIKYGLWTAQMKTASAVRQQVNSLRYSDIGIQIDPKDSQTHKLPRALNLTREHMPTSLRVIQFPFDPFSIYIKKEEGQEYIALDCIVIVESLMFSERLRKSEKGDWGSRAEAPTARQLQKQEYPPKGMLDTTSRNEDTAMKITFEVPENIVIRHRSPLIGKWNEQRCRWDPCSTSSYSGESVVRRCSFLTNDLAAMAIIQEKGFDVPYEQWQLIPAADDQVLFVIEGRRRGELSDREVRILVQDSLCRLVSPEEKELAPLRNNWMPVPTLLRLLSRAGYNFLLNDCDAEFIANMLPKTAVMEAKVYKDLAMFCTLHAFASSRHNKHGEDPNMCIFRMSKDQREAEIDEMFTRDVEEEDKWHAIRYEKERCVLSKFKEAENEPDLSSMGGKETHLNLYMLLVAEYGGNAVEARVATLNYLLMDSVLQLLMLTRPLTWG